MSKKRQQEEEDIDEEQEDIEKVDLNEEEEEEKKKEEQKQQQQQQEQKPLKVDNQALKNAATYLRIKNQQVLLESYAYQFLQNYRNELVSNYLTNSKVSKQQRKKVYRSLILDAMDQSQRASNMTGLTEQAVNNINDQTVRNAVRNENKSIPQISESFFLGTGVNKDEARKLASLINSSFEILISQVFQNYASKYKNTIVTRNQEHYTQEQLESPSFIAKDMYGYLEYLKSLSSTDDFFSDVVDIIDQRFTRLLENKEQRRQEKPNKKQRLNKQVFRGNTQGPMSQQKIDSFKKDENEIIVNPLQDQEIADSFNNGLSEQSRNILSQFINFVGQQIYSNLVSMANPVVGATYTAAQQVSMQRLMEVFAAFLAQRWGVIDMQNLMGQENGIYSLLAYSMTNASVQSFIETLLTGEEEYPKVVQLMKVPTEEEIREEAMKEVGDFFADDEGAIRSFEQEVERRVKTKTSSSFITSLANNVSIGLNFFVPILGQLLISSIAPLSYRFFAQTLYNLATNVLGERLAQQQRPQQRPQQQGRQQRPPWMQQADDEEQPAFFRGGQPVFRGERSQREQQQPRQNQFRRQQQRFGIQDLNQREREFLQIMRDIINNEFQQRDQQVDFNRVLRLANEQMERRDRERPQRRRQRLVEQQQQQQPAEEILDGIIDRAQQQGADINYDALRGGQQQRQELIYQIDRLLGGFVRTRAQQRRAREQIPDFDEQFEQVSNQVREQINPDLRQQEGQRGLFQLEQEPRQQRRRGLQHRRNNRRIFQREDPPPEERNFVNNFGNQQQQENIGGAANIFIENQLHREQNFGYDQRLYERLGLLENNVRGFQPYGAQAEYINEINAAHQRIRAIVVSQFFQEARQEMDRQGNQDVAGLRFQLGDEGGTMQIQPGRVVSLYQLLQRAFQGRGQGPFQLPDDEPQFIEFINNFRQEQAGARPQFQQDNNISFFRQAVIDALFSGLISLLMQKRFVTAIYDYASDIWENIKGFSRQKKQQLSKKNALRTAKKARQDVEQDVSNLFKTISNPENTAKTIFNKQDQKYSYGVHEDSEGFMRNVYNLMSYVAYPAIWLYGSVVSAFVTPDFYTDLIKQTSEQILNDFILNQTKIKQKRVNGKKIPVIELTEHHVDQIVKERLQQNFTGSSLKKLQKIVGEKAKQGVRQKGAILQGQGEFQRVPPNEQQIKSLSKQQKYNINMQYLKEFYRGESFGQFSWVQEQKNEIINGLLEDYTMISNDMIFGQPLTDEQAAKQNFREKLRQFLVKNQKIMTDVVSSVQDTANYFIVAPFFDYVVSAGLYLGKDVNNITPDDVQKLVNDGFREITKISTARLNRKFPGKGQEKVSQLNESTMGKYIEEKFKIPYQRFLLMLNELKNKTVFELSDEVQENLNEAKKQHGTKTKSLNREKEQAENKQQINPRFQFPQQQEQTPIYLDQDVKNMLLTHSEAPSLSIPTSQKENRMARSIGEFQKHNRSIQ